MSAGHYHRSLPSSLLHHRYPNIPVSLLRNKRCFYPLRNSSWPNLLTSCIIPILPTSHLEENKPGSLFQVRPVVSKDEPRTYEILGPRSFSSSSSWSWSRLILEAFLLCLPSGLEYSTTLKRIRGRTSCCRCLVAAGRPSTTRLNTRTCLRDGRDFRVLLYLPSRHKPCVPNDCYPVLRPHTHTRTYASKTARCALHLAPPKCFGPGLLSSGNRRVFHKASETPFSLAFHFLLFFYIYFCLVSVI